MSSENALAPLIRLCSDKVTYEAMTKQSSSFNMEKFRDALMASGGYQISAYTPYVLILRSSAGVEVTFSRYGRMLIRNVASEDEARKVATTLLKLAFEKAKG